MKKFGFIVVPVLLAVLIVGCGKASEKVAEFAMEKAIEKDGGGKAKVDLTQDGKMTITSDKGDVQIDASGAASVPEGFPEDVMVYAGKITTAMKMPEGFMVTIETDDAVEKVVAAYNEAMKAKGWTQENSLALGEQTMLGYKKDARTTAVIVAINEQSKKTAIMISAAAAQPAGTPAVQ